MRAPHRPGFFSTREVAGLLGLSEASVRSFVRAGFLTPERDAKGSLLFSFQELVLLRTAKGLQSAQVPGRRIKQSLRKLKLRLPSGRSLAGVSIIAEAGRVVVREGDSRFLADSGQALFDFEVKELADKVAPIGARAAKEAMRNHAALRASDWYDLGCELELSQPLQARDAYRRAIELDPHHADAHNNLGRLLHEAKQTAAAEAHYRLALMADPESTTAAFNLGVALEDLKRSEHAILVYETLLERDPTYADAHFNLSGLYERAGKAAAALRHLHAYRALRG